MPRLIPAVIDGHWPRVLAGLKVVQTKAPAEWTFDEVYRACDIGRAFLFVSPEGFCILKPVAGDVTTLHVWIVYAQGAGMLQRYEPEIERLARDIGAQRLTFTSPRAGYRRVMPHWVRNGNDYTRSLV